MDADSARRIQDHEQRLARLETPGQLRYSAGYTCYWDGARWLTTTEFSIIICYQTTNAAAFDTTFAVVRNDGYIAYWTYAAVHTYVSPTNNGSNFWSIDLQSVDNAITNVTTLAGFNTSALAAGGNYTSLGITTNLPTYRPLVRAHVTKTGAPSNLSLTMTAFYRLVIP